MKKIDLHTHSNASDGSMSPSELVLHAKEQGLSAFAITDHDTTSGLNEASLAAKTAGIELVKGVELAAWLDKTELHIVGLDIDPQNRLFSEAMQNLQKIREERNLKMITLMQNYGIDITPESFYEEEGHGVFTRANFANYLYTHGYTTSIKEAFDRFLANGRPFYLPRKKITPQYAIQIITEAGGIPILAHPLLYKIGKETLEKYISVLKQYGLMGIEVYYSTNSPSDDLYLSHLANKYDLAFSGGSDFHGSYKPYIAIGKGKGRLVVPYDILEKLRQKNPSN